MRPNHSYVSDDDDGDNPNPLLASSSRSRHRDRMASDLEKGQGILRSVNSVDDPDDRPISYDEDDADDVLVAPEERPHVQVLCLDMSYWSGFMQFMVLSGGVFVFFLAVGYVEEYTFRRLPKFKYGWYLTFFELANFAIFASVERLIVYQETPFLHNAPIHYHMGVAVAMTIARGLTNVSLQYLNYPTQVIFKSSKLLVVMLASVCVLAKKYGAMDYVSAILLVMSAILFSIGDSKVEPNYSHTGVIIIVCSLAGDAMHAITQEVTLRRASLLEIMFHSNIYAAVITFVFIFFTGELSEALEYCEMYPHAYILFALRSVVIYAGVLCFGALIKRFDVVVATTVTTVRKVLTILLSFVMFPKKFTVMYVYGVIVFCAGIYVNVRQKGRRHTK
jgi:solute carrier family 35 (adenosine 3'-phospho 5'-phosphosulfate transporter), member B3